VLAEAAVLAELGEAAVLAEATRAVAKPAPALASGQKWPRDARPLPRPLRNAGTLSDNRPISGIDLGGSGFFFGSLSKEERP